MTSNMTLLFVGDSGQSARVFDSFNRTNGSLGNTETLDYIGRAALAKAWAGATWAIATNKAANTPALGAELWDADAAVFTTGTYHWNALGTNTIANVGNALQVTYGNTATGAYCNLRNSADLSSDLTVGQWYRFSCTASINTGSCQMSVYTGTAAGAAVYSADITTTPGEITIYFLCHHATDCVVQFALLSSGEVVTIDNCSLKPVTNVDLHASLSTDFSDVVAACKVALTNGNPGGLMICMDSASNPQNFIAVQADGKYITWRKCVNGTYTSQVLYFESTNSYPSGLTEIAIEKNGETVEIWYHGKLVGTITVSDASIINNTIHGMYAVDPTTTINNYTLTNPASYIPTPNLFAVGDSITAGVDTEAETWVQGVATAKKWKPINMAHGATRVIGSTDYYMAWQVANVAGATTIICLMGTNDTDTTDTMRSTYQTHLATLITNNPTARIIALGCLARSTNDAEKVLISAQIAIAAANVGVEYYNTHAWIDPVTDTDDGLHPNTAGYAKITSEILAIL